MEIEYLKVSHQNENIPKYQEYFCIPLAHNCYLVLCVKQFFENLLTFSPFPSDSKTKVFPMIKCRSRRKYMEYDANTEFNIKNSKYVTIKLDMNYFTLGHL